MSIANLISKVTGVVCVPDRLAHPGDAVTLDLAGYSQIDEFSCGAVAGWIVLEAFDRRRQILRRPARGGTAVEGQGGVGGVGGAAHDVVLRVTLRRAGGIGRVDQRRIGEEVADELADVAVHVVNTPRIGQQFAPWMEFNLSHARQELR